MNKQRMIKMLGEAKQAALAAGLYNQTINQLDQTSFPTEGTQNLIGQLILASAVEESGSSIGMSLDKLEGLALEISEVADSIKCVAANLPNTE